MIDREKVLKGLQIERECVSRNCNRDCEKCDLVQDRDYLLSVYDGAIAMLKEQEPRLITKDDFANADAFGKIQEAITLLKEQEGKKVIVREGEEATEGNIQWFADCPQCNRALDREKHPRYCGFCGQEVEWE